VIQEDVPWKILERSTEELREREREREREKERKRNLVSEGDSGAQEV